MASERLPRAFWFLFAGALVNRIGSCVVPLFTIYLVGERGYSPSRAGLVVSLYGAGSLASGLLGGWLADRVGRKTTMIAGFLWSAVAMLMVATARSPWAIAAATFHLGLSGDLYRPAVQAAIADLCAPSLRPRAYGLIYWAVNLGFAAAAAIGGTLAKQGFSLLFVIDAGTTCIFAAIVAVFVPETRPLVAATETREQGGLSEVFRDRVFILFIAVQCLVSVLYLQSHGALPIALQRHGIGVERYGLVIALNGVLIVVFQPFAVGIVPRLRRTRVLALGALLVGLGFGYNGLPLGIVGAATSVAVWTFGEIISTPVIPTLIADLAPTHLRGRYQGVGQMSYGLCALIGPMGGMFVLQYAGDRGLWALCLLLGVTASGLYLGSARRLAVRLAGRGAPA